MNKFLFHNATIINEGRSFLGYLSTEGDRICAIGEGNPPASLTSEYLPEESVDLQGKLLLPGVIDDQVHFREPGLTHKANIASESRAAAAGGVTSFMDMPNTRPATVKVEAWEDKMKRGEETSVVNYSFFAGATNSNIEELKRFDRKYLPGIKVFMGSSTGNMLVDDNSALDSIFSLGDIVAVHSESERIIKENSERYLQQYGENNVPISCHPDIRSREACMECSRKAVEIAERNNARLHILHLSTAEETELLKSVPLRDKRVTGEVCVHHLWFTDEDYAKLGSRIKCNPAIKSRRDRDALREAVNDGRIDIVATDHAPHLLEEKEGDALHAASGCPLIQFSLLAMLEMAGEGVFSREKVVETMCHNPAILYGIRDRGFLREGMKADLTIVDPEGKTEVRPEILLSSCGWSPFEGHTFPAKVVSTLVNGRIVWDGNRICEDAKGEAIEYCFSKSCRS